MQPDQAAPAATDSAALAPALNILSLSLVFPNPAAPTYGVFVQSRLRQMAAAAHVLVIAPVALIDYAHWRGSGRGGGAAAIPGRRSVDRLEVLHPHWFYPPGLGFLNGVFLFARILPLAWRLRRDFPFQVIDAHFGHPTGLAAALLSTVLHRPFTVTLRGDEPMHAGFRLRRAGMRWALRRAARVFTVSGRLRDFALAMGVAPERARTIPNGIDTDRFYPRDRAEIRRRHGMPEDRPMILSAGFLIERKGHHRAVRALAGLREGGLPAELWIVGGPGREGRFEGAIREEVRRWNLDPFVHFAGMLPREDVAEYMSAADVVCLASTREGWPNVVHEALGCGTPVVACDVGGVPDLIPSSNYGYVVPVGDQAALEAALRDACCRQWDRQAIAAWARSRSWEQVAAETLAELRQALQSAPKDQ